MALLAAISASPKVVATTAVAVTGALGAVGAVAAFAFGTALVAPAGARTAEVIRIVDGDTLDVLLDGTRERVRLLNVDAPESVDPNSSVECLGPEASEFLSELLPAGKQVQLLFDVEQRDRYDRLLAGVVADGKLANAEVARAGLGVAVLIEPNDRFFGDVQAAQAEAQVSGVGMNSADVPCSLPGRVAEFTALVATAAAAPIPEGLTEIESGLAEIGALVAAGSVLARALESESDLGALALRPNARRALARELAPARDRVAAAQSGFREARAVAVAEAERLAAEVETQRLAAEAEAEAARIAKEAARVAAEEEAARQAAAEAERRAELADAERRAVAERAAEAERRAEDGATSGSGSGDNSGYTGCRKYAPGGKTWTPIPCP